ncbi:MAG: glycosyltransferase family 39 protein [Burkholderiales bacterium]|nr:glycosyltransferase family 39 protein [Burkholderiales bacterium]MBK8667232.1 glycosyltransferase family 39 protein [Burkholderiales bacterium]
MLFAIAWLALLALAERTPPIDNVEQWVWSHGLAWGYYKHPPLPTWIAAGVQVVLGRTPIVINVLGALCAITTFVMFWHLLRQLYGRAFALLALLAVLCLTYSTQRLHYFNHNTVLMPLTAAIALLLWRATNRPWRWTWAVIGLLIGTGLLAKYQMALVAACVGLWWLRLEGWRDAEHRVGALWCVLAALAVFSPHLWWLVVSDWAPLNSARQSSLGAALPWRARPGHVLHWLLDWFGNRLLPAWIFLALAAWVLAHRLPAPGTQGAGNIAATVTPVRTARQFLMLWGLVPPLLMAGLGLAAGVQLQFKWSTSFALWTVPAIMACLPLGSWITRTRELPRSIWIGFFILQLLLAVWLGVSAYRGMGMVSTATLPNWSQRDFKSVARVVDEQARASLDGPVQVICGPYGVSGAIAQHLPQSPQVLIDGSLDKSPWLSAESLRGARAVHVAPACELPEGAFWIMPGWIGWTGYGIESPGFSPALDLWREAVAHGGYSRVQCP